MLKAVRNEIESEHYYRVASSKTGYSGIIKDDKRADFAKSNDELFEIARGLKEGYTSRHLKQQTLDDTKELQDLFKILVKDKTFLDIE